MFTSKTLVSLALLVSRLAFVQAGVYVTSPVQSTVCQAGQPCSVEWVDDGQSPLLSDIGECTVGLYNGEMVLTQSLPSVNVASAHSFTFTPSPSTSDDGSYYLVFTSTSDGYQSWSGTFSVGGSTGSSTTDTTSTTSGSSTLGGSSSSSTQTSPSVASTLSVPSTVSSGTSTHSTTATSAATSATPSATQSGAATRAGASTSLAGGLILALAGALVF
ncbi:uncharacterized protein HD556DRAFT_1330718 [Suillus plorans]|uniref:Yeast cell wall synthesis Kre9/Knh1-like N-terminal domain-containing protein n=1 Tax=Suillus plorans TaxID=116603 RepID=A0A9P7DV12_9AGAM|nr:uncharacterized protein HD556DRAFT_1330718 [Suillus plorans]KAG1803869.1 hypothetical protein HD556DRAFT_1330718 [Suillus plorans]